MTVNINSEIHSAFSFYQLSSAQKIMVLLQNIFLEQSRYLLNMLYIFS